MTEDSINRDYKLHPTTSSVITLQCDPLLIGEEYVVYDAVGKVVMRGKVKASTFELSFENLAAGSYVLKAAGQAMQVVKE